MKKSYAVGYRKPPKHSRFKPGQSGNPKGRPKGARSLDAALQAELKQTVAVTENGRTRRLPKQVVAIKKLVNNAMLGDTKALQIVLGRTDRLGTASPPGELEPIDKLILRDYERRVKQGRDDA